MTATAAPLEQSPASNRMRRQAERDTRPELALRRQLHSLGLRFFIHRRPIATLRRTADIVFPRQRIAVLVHGCFWHGCPSHGSWPSTNAGFWRRKIETNRARDAETASLLQAAGWRVFVVWEHEPPGAAAKSIERGVRGAAT